MFRPFPKNVSVYLALMALLGSAVARPAAAQPLSFQQRLAGPAPASLFGYVAVDGVFAVIGAPGENSRRGAAYVLENVNGTWTLRQQLTAPDGQASDHFGYSVSISGDTIAIGAYQHDAAINNGGAVYVFVRDGASWVQQVKLIASDAENGLGLGRQVVVDGNLVAASATGADLGPVANVGAVYVFERSGASWSQAKLQPLDGTANNVVSTSLDLANGTLCAASHTQTNPGGYTGAVYVYVRSGPGTWSNQQKLLAPVGSVGDTFGGACAVNGNTVAVSSRLSLNPGRVHIFTRSGLTWGHQQTLQSSDNTASFGQELTLSGDRLVAGAGGFGSSTGRAYVVERVGGTWAETQILDGTGLVTNDGFGNSVASDAQTVLVGAPNFGSATTSPGSVHVFRASTSSPTPGAPANFAATVAGNTVNMSWSAPAIGGPPTSYTVLARTATGGPIVASLPVGTATTLGVAAPNGTFVVSVRAANGAGNGPESLPVTIAVPQAAPLPGPPSALAVSVAGSTATFTWNAPATGGTPTGYTLLAGVTPSFATPIASLPLPPTPRSVAVGGVPAGTYYVRVRATNAGGVSADSNEVTLTVAGATPPGVPILNSPSVAGNTVSLSWSAGAGGTPSGYTLVARATPAGAPIVSVPLSGTSASFPGVPAGTYYLQLVATNAAGSSGPSAQVTLVVP